MKKVIVRAPVRADLAGGTLDLWPLYLFHPGSRTVNVAISYYAEAEVVETGGGIELHLTDQQYEQRYESLNELAADSVLWQAHQGDGTLTITVLPPEAVTGVSVSSDTSPQADRHQPSLHAYRLHAGGALPVGYVRTGGSAVRTIDTGTYSTYRTVLRSETHTTGSVNTRSKFASPTNGRAESTRVQRCTDRYSTNSIGTKEKTPR